MNRSRLGSIADVGSHKLKNPRKRLKKKILEDKRKNKGKESAAKSENEVACCICYGENIEDYGILDCKHEFCFDCIKSWSEAANNCPLCKRDFLEIKRYNKSKKFVESIAVEPKKIDAEEELEIDPELANGILSK